MQIVNMLNIRYNNLSLYGVRTVKQIFLRKGELLVTVFCHWILHKRELWQVRVENRKRNKKTTDPGGDN